MSPESRLPHPTPLVAAIPPMTPFVAPEELARRVGRTELLRLGANESAFGPSPRAIAAMRDAVALTSWYGDPESIALRTALAARHGCTVDELVIASGIDDLMGLIVRAFCGPGDACVATLGTYPTLFYHLNAFGARAEFAEPDERGGIVPDAIVDAVRRSGAKLVYVANPDNPSGGFVDRATLASLREALPSDVLLFLDEAYADFVSRDELPSDVVDPRTIRTRTFSKAFGMAGARIGYAIASSDVIAAFQKLRLHFGVNRTAQIGALAALDDDAFLRGVVAEVERGRAEYHALAAAHGAPSLPSRTNFVCIGIGTRAQADAMVTALLELGVFVRKPWAPPIDGYIRVTVGTATERAAFAERFAEALDGVREKAAR
ncbi:histidinol-phosphate aminotransferase [Vulcanimicrobium alpinum]|uniref:histidinol-phosphate transaminase n=1 Tax=Vulcanimicrobium alpinum TaxID=3016050 RepID=A0AAN1XYN3_UNVUL|nr:aminotransferase class I/II-fold pyridoxal phosphate-dependent enzyme [Vulcanimicrobium alpinum]BDE07101.1 histidinol-phosphate aminotransferase [Vulcanimicrobium alpinum]